MSPLARPPAPTGLGGFPRRQLLPSQPLFRIHRHDRDPWWFSSDGSGRFDLSGPLGTCYLAEDPLGAFVEVFRDTARPAAADVEARRVSTLHVPAAVALADCTSRRARGFGITAAIHSSSDYGATQAWAEAFAAAGFDGVRYRVSHDPGQRLIGIALFGRAGPAPWPSASTGAIGADVLRQARRVFGIWMLPDR